MKGRSDEMQCVAYGYHTVHSIKAPTEIKLFVGTTVKANKSRVRHARVETGDTTSDLFLTRFLVCGVNMLL
jgi:hypothetical protein